MAESRPQRIAPSILSADMADLGGEMERLEVAGADWAHVDVMDGRFVPNLTVGLPVVAALRRRTKLPLDVHLMIVEPERYVEAFVRAGADVVTIHAEACVHLYHTLETIRAAGARAGVALNPGTPAVVLEPVLEVVDLVLIMTVEPGFGGQRFLPACLRKISQVAEWVERRSLAVDIEVDGGIKEGTIGQVARAGANVFVSGTGVFGRGDLAGAISGLRVAARAVEARGAVVDSGG